MSKNLVQLNRWNEKHSHPSVPTLYRWLYQKKPAWFRDVVTRIGGVWFVDEEAFFREAKKHTFLEGMR